MYFAKHKINTLPAVALRTDGMTAAEYDTHLHALLSQAEVLEPSLDPCQKDNIPPASGPLAIYIDMKQVRLDGRCRASVEARRIRAHQ